MVKQKDGSHLKFGRYHIQYELAAGGMGSVYFGKDPVLQRPVAIKVLHSKFHQKKVFLERFNQEAQTVAQLRSPHIVEVYDFGIEAKSPYLVMEFVDGLSLHGVLENLYPDGLDPVVAAALICQASEGLAAASQRGVVHRDIKPENLLISPSGYLKIADFGISHVTDNSMTRTGAVVGTVQYMSPEQTKGEKGISIQSDMFSLGTVFYVCLSGVQPFKTESFPGTIQKIVSEPHPPLESIRPDLDKELIDLVNTLLQKDPKSRGGGPNWLRTKLREYLYRKRITDPVERIRLYLSELSGKGIQTTGFISPLQIAAAGRAIPKLPVPDTKRRTWLLAVAAVFVSCLLVLTGAILWRIQQIPEPRPQVDAHELKYPGELPPLEGKEDTAQRPLVAVNTPPAKSNEVVRKPRASKRAPKPQRQIPDSTKVEESATVTIYTAPPFAEISIDGVAVGTSPLLNRTLEPGRHTVQLEAPQLNLVWDTTLYISPGIQRFKFRIPAAFE